MGIIDLGLVWFLVWILKNATVDVACAVKGQPNPRYEQRKAAKAAAGQRYGLGDWWSDLVADGLRATTEWRRRRAARKRQGQDHEWPEVEKPQAEVVERPRPRPRPSLPDPTAADVPTARPKPEPTRPAPQPNPPAPPPQQDPTAAPVPAPTNVVPFARKINEFKESDVAVAATEVIGLDQSIDYANELAEHAREHGLAGNEAYAGHLTEQKVTGAALTTAHEMQEAFDLAAAAAERHATELTRQKTVQEQYDTNPDAGDKDFQTQGR